MPENVRFNTRFYKKKAIQKAILAYAHLAKFRVKDCKDYLEVKIENIDTQVKDIFVDEFNNYVLGATKKCC
ncbi:MAG: HxsD-like protein [Candidatus Omnitrophica bacterium]|nr:HxsD-like protein [Candidatus Omnitrophota bacterium]